MMNKKITRKDFLKRGGAGLGSLLLQAALPTGRGVRAQGKDRRPNILFICMDQLRSLPDVPEKLPLPSLRGLLRESRVFRNYHVHQAPCGPSRSTFYTGQHIQKTGIYTNPTGEFGEYTEEAHRSVELKAGFPTLGSLLRAQGYYAAYKGKWHLSVINQKLGKDKFPNAAKALEPYGFSDYNFDGEHSGLTWAGFGHDGVTASESINLLERFAAGGTGGKPWFLAVNFVNPHDIMFFDSRGQGAGNGAELFGMPLLERPGTALYEKDWHFGLPRSYGADDLSTKPAVQRPPRPLTEEQLRVYQNYYFNCIRDVDQHVGSVLAAIARLGLAHNTLVIATADHGEMAGAHGGMIGKGADIYKETLRVPLLVRHPDARGAGATDALVGSIDLVPTLLSFAGLSDAERQQRYPDLHGVDVSSVVADGRARTARDERGVLFNYGTPPGGLGPNGPTPGNPVRGLIRGVFDGRYKFGRYFKLTEHHVPRDWETLLAHNDLELYDTHRDPDEIVNLAFRPEERKAQILDLSGKVNALIEAEIGADNGSIYPGSPSQYSLQMRNL
jgi:arylsulfatase A-like enzyme